MKKCIRIVIGKKNKIFLTVNAAADALSTMVKLGARFQGH